MSALLDRHVVVASACETPLPPTRRTISVPCLRIQATSLVLRQPGDSAADGLAGVMVQMGRTPPLVGADPVPPLWTLLPFLSHQRGSRAPAAERAFGGGRHSTATLNAEPPSSSTSEGERDVDESNPSEKITDEDFHALFVDN